jgi:hypothetical protein
MLSLPTLPTDSLYKFLFIGGIILCAFCGYYSYERDNRVSIQDKKLDSLRILSDASIGVNMLKLDSAKIVNNIKGREGKPTQRQWAKYLIAQQRILTELRRDSVMWEQEKLNSKYIKKTYEAQEQIYQFATFLASMMVACGIMFWFWYHQKHQDSIAEIQVKLMQLQLETAQIELKKLKENNEGLS